MADNSPIVAEPPAEPAAPPTLESLIAEFNRGIGDEFKAATVADMIRQRDNPPEPAAPSSAPVPDGTPAEPDAEAEPLPSAEPEPAQSERRWDDIDPELWSRAVQMEQDKAMNAALERMAVEGVPETRIREKLSAIISTDEGWAAFEQRGAAWHNLISQARTSIAEEFDQHRAASYMAAKQNAGYLHALRSAGAAPMPEEKFDPIAASKMSDTQWEAYKELLVRTAQRK